MNFILGLGGEEAERMLFQVVEEIISFGIKCQSFILSCVKTALVN